MTTMIEIKNPTAPATDAQIELIRHLAGQFEAYGPAQVDQIVAMSSTKAKASETIEKLLAAGATKPAKPATQRPTNSKATDKQVAYAMSLLRRVHWHDTDLGQAGPAPTAQDLRRMTRREISALIDDLKKEI